METIDQQAQKMGLERGYYLLLMAILDLPEEKEHKKNEDN